MSPRKSPSGSQVNGANWRGRVIAISPLLFVAAIAWALGAPPSALADTPWNYAVQITATVDPGSSQITLRWVPPDPQANGGAVPQHTVYRKPVSELDNPDWGPGTPVPAGQNSFTDTVQSGVAYEYKVTRTYSGIDPQFNGVGYVRTGIAVPLVENRGTVLLVVESSIADSLAGEIGTLMDDLAGDGWRVVRIDGFSAGSKPSDLQARIRQEYSQSGGDARAVFLLGHLPVVMSGTATNPDGHFVRPMPADGFYGDVRGDWGTANFDGQHWVYSANTFPAPLVLAVGRVDFADLPAIYAVSPFSSEVALLKNYLAKDHAYRTAARVPQRRALIGDAFGEYYFEDVVEPFAANGYRNFAPLFGDQITVDDNYHGGHNAQNWLGDLANGSYLWVYGCGPGGDSGDSIGGLAPSDLHSSDFVTRNAQGEFYLVFGSFMENWAVPNNLLRSTLAAQDYGLGCTWSGRPFVYIHAMGLGETLGYGFRLSENATGTLYDTPVTVRPGGNSYVGGVHMALLGDPTLRLDPVAPVTNFSSDAASGTATWNAPGGPDVQEYRVYVQSDNGSPWQLEATLPAPTRTYTPTHTGRHMIRAVVLQRGSGTYYNASEGVFWSVTAVGNPPPQPPPPPPPPPSGPTPNPPAPQARNVTGLINLSTRLHISSGGAANGATAGFVVAGNSPVQLLIRAVGPSLATFGITDPVSSPQLRVVDAHESEVARNAGWNDDASIAAAAAAVGAFKLNFGSHDAAALVTLNPGSYTTQVQSSAPGTVLVEVYPVQANGGDGSSPVVNLSTRGVGGSGNSAIVGGFVLSGSDPQAVLIRAIGPGLSAFGVGGAMADPVLTLHDESGNVIARNDNWETPERSEVVVGPTWGDIAQADGRVGAFPLGSGSKDSALVVLLRPGSYTATIEGADGSSGSALLEVYQLP